MTFTIQQNNFRLVYKHEHETVWVEAWGHNAVRVRAAQHLNALQKSEHQRWALNEEPTKPSLSTFNISISEDASLATLVNGHLRLTCSSRGGKLQFYNEQTCVLQEFVRQRHEPIIVEEASALEIDARTYRPIRGTQNFHITCRFEAHEGERLFGMGQYQQTNLNVKGCDLELAQRNSQASVPFLTSSRGYGFLWNSPAIGRAVFGKNVTTFESQSSTMVDYWLCVGQTPAEIQETYASVTGKVPMMPEYGLGFWQCKLRYQTQDEILNVVREHCEVRKLPMDVVVVDFFHWPFQGDFKFDDRYWPDAKAMIDELKSKYNVKLMVSVWPTVDKRSENFQELARKGCLTRCDAGVQTQMEFCGESRFVDFTNPDAQREVWQIIKRNYYDKGVQIFWLDEAEPEFSAYAYEQYRFHLGSCLEVGNYYPVAYAQAFFQGQQAAGQSNIVNLLRCAWAGSQRFGTLVWSGDIASTWTSLRCQLSAGLNMGLSGIPWWTTDIGGFHGGDGRSADFRELFVRWFQWATYCPVMRLHGARKPKQAPLGSTENSQCCSYADNEVWSYGEDVFRICKAYLTKREAMRPYIRSLMKQAHERGTPVTRTMFYEYPKDELCWAAEDQYMFGDKYLVAPILAAGQRNRQVYLPRLEKASSKWTWNGKSFDGGQLVEVDAPLEEMPVLELVH